MPPVPVIGLEVHVQLATGTKIFCRCPADPAPPNARLCPVCAGFPGSLPVLDRRAVELALRVAAALGSQVSRRSAFDRKSYFYPDLPKGYQITQHATPLATGGRIPLLRHDRSISVRRLHLEEDAGRRVRFGGDRDGIDLGRAGVPLLEIVTEPELETPEEAGDCLRTLHGLVRDLGVSDAALEEGSLRCDVNVSLASDGARGARTEVKNVSSFRFVARSVRAEIARQRALLDRGERIEAVTLGYDESSDSVRVLRSKERSQDYRFFPEPDLDPVDVPPEEAAAAAARLPELPWALRDRLEALGLDRPTALLFVEARTLRDFLERTHRLRAGSPSWSDTAAWIRSEVVAGLRERGIEGETPPLSATRLAELLDLVAGGRLSRRAAKEVLDRLWEASERSPLAIAEAEGLLLEDDPERLDGWIRGALEENAEPVSRYLGGQTGVLGFLIGQVLKRSGGSADPAEVRRRLREELDGRR